MFWKVLLHASQDEGLDLILLFPDQMEVMNLPGTIEALKHLRWLDWIFQKSYCSSLKINYDATSNVMVKQLPQLYYKKMKVCCDWCYVDIGVSIAT